MNTNIIINSAPCANAKDLALHLEKEYGLFTIDFSLEFELETGYGENEAINEFGYNRYSEMRSEVIDSLCDNLTKPSVIVLVANSVSVDELSKLGFLYALEMSSLPAEEIAEHVFDQAADCFCGEAVEELLAA